MHVVELQGHSGARFTNSQIYGDIIVEATNHGPLTFSACGLLGSMWATNGIGLARIATWVAERSSGNGSRVSMVTNLVQNGACYADLLLVTIRGEACPLVE